MAERKNFSVETSEAERDRGMAILDKMHGKNNAEKLSELFSIIEEQLEQDVYAERCRGYTRSIQESLENIGSTVSALLSAATEERKNETAELQAQIEGQSKSIKRVEDENEILKARAVEAEAAKDAAEKAAEAAKIEAAEAEKIRKNYEKALQDKDELLAKLHTEIKQLNRAAKRAADNDVLADELNDPYAQNEPKRR